MNDNSKVFSTGVYLKPEKVIINEKEQWRWVAVGFEDDTYFNGNHIELNDYADKFEYLIINEN